MARKVVNRKELRAEAEAAEKKTAKKKTTKTAKKKKTTKRKGRAAASEVRLKALWGVFNQSMKRVAVFDYNERKKADKKAEDLSKSSKSPHFVQLVKEAIEE